MIPMATVFGSAKPPITHNGTPQNETLKRLVLGCFGFLTTNTALGSLLGRFAKVHPSLGQDWPD
jgi:hypothetical protein